MATLPDDCFAHSGNLLRLDDALTLLSERVRPITGVETVALASALGRILAADIVATRAVPPHDNAAVDGYAVSADDISADAPTRLKVVGRIAAGQLFDGRIERGMAARIFTGAPIPSGADTVAMQEACRVDGDHVILPPGLRRGANCRRAGEDVETGTTILAAGRRLRAPDIGLAASIGVAVLPVHRRLRVALFSTGDEIREPGTDAPPGSVYDANRFALNALLQGLGCVVEDLGIVADRLGATRDLLSNAARNNDLIVSSGGVSVGEEDHVRAAVVELGSLHFWRLAIKPGKPIALGQIGHVPFVGLPGNPVAVLVTFLRIARPLALRLAGASDVTPMLYRAIADFDYAKKADRREWLRVRVTANAGAAPTAHLYPRKGSGILSSMVESDGLVELSESTTEIERGMTIDFLPFNEVG